MKKTRTAKTYVSEKAQKELKGKGIIITHPDTDEGRNDKYSKARFIQVYKGYDMLGDLFAVRTFIQKQYDINTYLFEILLKLMALRVFTRAEYREIPKSFKYSKFNNILDTGLVNMVMDHWDTERRLFALNTKGKNIMINFYKYLSGEKRIPETARYNVMANSKKQVAYDKKKLELIKRMNKLPIPEHKKFLFED